MTVDALSLATWPLAPKLEHACARWTHNLNLKFTAAVQADWTLAASYWAT